MAGTEMRDPMLTRLKQLCVAALTGLVGSAALAAPAFADDPLRASLREGKADWDDKELSVLYAFGPGALDFGFTDFLSVGISTDQVFSPHNWYYRGTWKIVNKIATHASRGGWAAERPA